MPAALLFAVAALVPAQLLPAATASAGETRSAGTGDAVLDVVVLVDESGSESPASVAEERQTAGTIDQTLLNPRSRVTIIGFGGVNNVAPHQVPTNVACRPTIADGPTSLSYLAKCVTSLHRRTGAEGDDTDYAAALGQALSYFNPGSSYGQQSPPGAIKVILMMTDGGLYVGGDPQYGKNWRVAAHQAVNAQLKLARADDVHVWPLGFGKISPRSHRYLDYLAAKGAGTGCDRRRASKPHATVVQNPSRALVALDTLYAAASCSGINGSSVDLSANETRSLQVNIPVVASDAAISVARGNPGVQVSFYAPDGRLWTDYSALSGIKTAVVVLHLTNPQPGHWRIQLTAPPDLTSDLVRATTLWQGAVNAMMQASPTSAQPGQRIDVTLSVLGPDGPITDPDALTRMRVVVSVSGDGLSGPVRVPVTSAGLNEASSAGLGDYTGTFTAPRRDGKLTFTGTAAGYGLYAKKTPVSVQVSRTSMQPQPIIQVPVGGSVQVGQSITGRILFANKTGAARRVRISLSVRHAYATISPGGPIEVRSGNPPPTPFTITIAKKSPPGFAWFDVKVIGTGVDSPIGSQPFELSVTTPPGFLTKYIWALILAAVVLAASVVALLLLRRAHQKAADVRGLRVSICRNGEQRGVELRAPGRAAKTFRFVIRDEGEQDERLNTPRPGDAVYEARRNRPGHVEVEAPDGKRYDITVDGTGEPLASGLVLSFRDTPPVRRENAQPHADEGRETAHTEPDRWLT